MRSKGSKRKAREQAVTHLGCFRSSHTYSLSQCKNPVERGEYTERYRANGTIPFRAQTATEADNSKHRPAAAARRYRQSYSSAAGDFKTQSGSLKLRSEDRQSWREALCSAKRRADGGVTDGHRNRQHSEAIRKSADGCVVAHRELAETSRGTASSGRIARCLARHARRARCRAPFPRAAHFSLRSCALIEIGRKADPTFAGLVRFMRPA